MEISTKECNPVPEVKSWSMLGASFTLSAYHEQAHERMHLTTLVYA